MLNSSNSSSLVIIQKYILLVTGMSSSVALRNKVVALHEQTDDLDQVAELVDTFMTELNKNNHYNSSQAANAAREWLANIRATDESLATCTEAIQGLIDSFNDGNVQSKVIAENGNGIQNSDELATTIGGGGDSTAATPLAAPPSSPPVSPAGDDRTLLII